MPVLPSLPRLLELVFIAIRQQHQYIWHNARPTATVELASEDVETGVRIYDLGGTDPNRDRLIVTVGQPEHGAVVKNADGTYTYTPDAAYAYSGGEDSFTVTVSDDTRFHMHAPLFFGGHSDSTTETFVIAATNKPPTVTVVPVGDPDDETGETAYQVTVGDPEGKPVTYQLLNGPQRGTLTPAAGNTYTYVPDADYAHQVAAGADGEDSFTVRATDELGLSADYTVPITIAPQNDAPVITIAQVGADSYQITVSDDDDDPDVVITGPAHGSLDYDATSGVYVYTPDPEYAHAILHGGPDTDSFTVTVDDGHGGIDTATQSMTVLAQNADLTVELTAGTPDPVTGKVILTVVAPTRTPPTAHRTTRSR